MLEARRLYEQELARCRTTPEAISWQFATVAEDRILVVVCQSCSDQPSWEDAIVEAVHRARWRSCSYCTHIASKDD